MKLQQLKDKVYETSNKLSKQLKKVHQHLDLRYKASWEYLYNYYMQRNTANKVVSFAPRGGVRQATLPTQREMTRSAIASGSRFSDMTREEFEARLAAR